MTHANAVTLALQAANITITSPVAVLLEPSPASILTLLSNTGALYLPLDLTLPLARLAAIVHNWQPKIMLVDKDSKQHMSKLKKSSIQ